MRSAAAAAAAAIACFLIALTPAATFADDAQRFAAPTTTLPLGLPPDRDGKLDGRPAVDYGEFLFRSPLLSADRTVACASCHVPALGFSGPQRVAIGIGGIAGRRHPPPLLNLYAAGRLMLDGRAANLADQIHLPLESPIEMKVDWPASLRALSKMPETRSFLAAASQSALTRSLVLNSLAAYVRSLVTGDSPFDRFYYRGDQAAISEQAKQGLLLFVRKGRCAGCHLITGYAAPLTDNNFHSTGIGFVDGAYRDDGRADVTGSPQDRGLFKTPALRNVAERRYFMHDGSLGSLRAVLDYYNRGGNRGAPNLDGRIRPLYLTEEEEGDIIAYLRTLTSPIVSYRPE